MIGPILLEPSPTGILAHCRKYQIKQEFLDEEYENEHPPLLIEFTAALSVLHCDLADVVGYYSKFSDHIELRTFSHKPGLTLRTQDGRVKRTLTHLTSEEITPHVSKNSISFYNFEFLQDILKVAHKDTVQRRFKIDIRYANFHL